jgi:hypothetical protein
MRTGTVEGEALCREREGIRLTFVLITNIMKRASQHIGYEWFHQLSGARCPRVGTGDVVGCVGELAPS